jgi:uncharacterized protein (DUF433 family)
MKLTGEGVSVGFSIENIRNYKSKEEFLNDHAHVPKKLLEKAWKEAFPKEEKTTAPDVEN